MTMTVEAAHANLLPSSTTLDADRASDPMRIDRCSKAAIQLVWTGAAVGNWTLQYSCDATNEPGAVTNWTDVDTQAAGGAAGNHIFDCQTGARWVRVFYDFTSGTGTWTVAQCSKKGV